MRKALRIISLAGAVISAVAAFVLACVYLEDVLTFVKAIKKKLTDRKKDPEDEEIFEFEEE